MSAEFPLRWLITSDPDEAARFADYWGLPLEVSMCFVQTAAMDVDETGKIADQEIFGFIDKNMALMPWLNQENMVHAREAFLEVVARIIAPPCPRPVMLQKPVTH